MATSSESTEFTLRETLDANISRIRFSPKSNLLLASFWDSHLSLFDVEENKMLYKFKSRSPVLGSCFKDQDESCCFSGGIDNKLWLIDFNKITTVVTIGEHTKPISGVEYCSEINAIITGSYDNYLKLWDTRSPRCVAHYDQGKPVNTMSVCDGKVVVGLGRLSLVIWDLRSTTKPFLKREKDFKSRVTAIKCFSNSEGYAVGTTGRVAIEFFNPSSERENYFFKCHRIKQGFREIGFTVNAISFHPLNNSFATSGLDGRVNIWDPYLKKNLCKFQRNFNSTSALSFNHDGSLLAIACPDVNAKEIVPGETAKDSIVIKPINQTLHLNK